MRITIFNQTKVYPLVARFYPILVLLALVIIFFGKTLTGEKIFVTPGDTLVYEYATKYFLSDSLKNYQLPLWNQYTATGFPQMGTITGSFNPLNLLIFYLLPMPLAFNLYLASIFFMTGFFTYLFARLIKISRSGSLLCAITITFSGIMVSKIPLSIMLQTFSMFPLELYLAEKYIQKKRSIFLCFLSLAVGFQFLAGYFQVVLYSLIMLIAYVTLRVYSEKRNILRSVGIFFIPLIAGFLIAAVQLLPSIEFTALSTRSGGVDIETIEKFPYPLKHVVTFLWPYLLGDPRNGTYPVASRDWGFFWENTGYMGIVQFFLAFLAVFWGFKQSKYVKIFVIIVTFSFILMLGKYSPSFFLYNIPPLSFFRVPARWIMFLTFGLVILSGFGFDSLHNRFKKIVRLVIFTAAAFSLLLFSFGYNIKGNSKLWLKDTQTAKFIKSRGQPNERIITLGSTALWDELLKIGWIQTPDKLLALMESLVPNFNVVYKLNHANIYPVIQTQRGITFNSALKRNIIVNTTQNTTQVNKQARDLLDILNVRYIISPVPMKNSGYPLVFSTSTNPQFFIYENQAAIPGVFLVSDWVLIPDQKEQYRMLIAGDLNLKKTAIVEQEIPKLNLKKGEARVARSDNSNIEVEATLDGDGMLILAESYYPGWKARVDGKEVKILPVNINQRGVLLKTGRHIVKFSYQPESFKNGVIISLATLALTFALIIRKRHEIL